MRSLLIAAACVQVIATSVQAGTDFTLVEAGEPRAVVFAPNENRWAG